METHDVTYSIYCSETGQPDLWLTTVKTDVDSEIYGCDESIINAHVFKTYGDALIALGSFLAGPQQVRGIFNIAAETDSVVLTLSKVVNGHSNAQAHRFISFA